MRLSGWPNVFTGPRRGEVGGQGSGRYSGSIGQHVSLKRTGAFTVGFVLSMARKHLIFSASSETIFSLFWLRGIGRRIFVMKYHHLDFS